MSVSGAVPLIHFCIARLVLAAPATLSIWAEDAGQVESGLQILDVLQAEWGPDGPLTSLAQLPLGTSAEVSWDTALLLAITEPPGLELELGAHRVTRTGAVELPSVEIRQALLTELLVQELRDAGCPVATVVVGTARASTGSVGSAGAAGLPGRAGGPEVAGGPLA